MLTTSSSTGEIDLTAEIIVPAGDTTPVASAPGTAFEPKDEYNAILDRWAKV